MVELFLERQYEAALNVLKDTFNYKYPQIFTIGFKVFAHIKDERLLACLCKELIVAAQDIKLIDYTKRNKWIKACFRYNVLRQSRFLSTNCLIISAKCLEELWAYGVTGIDKLIVELYGAIGAEQCLVPAEVRLSKELSYVYIVDRHNYDEIRQKLRNTHKYLKSAGYNHLLGLYSYYRAIIMRAGINDYPYSNQNKMNTKLRKSSELGCRLADIYISHHKKNFETSKNHKQMQ